MGKQISKKDLHCFLLYLVELQKALTIAEEQVENVKVRNRIIDTTFDRFSLCLQKERDDMSHTLNTLRNSHHGRGLSSQRRDKYSSIYLIVFQGHPTVQPLQFPQLHLVHQLVFHRIYHLLHHYHRPVLMNILFISSNMFLHF